MPVWTPTLYVGTRHARYEALGSSLRGQITREMRPLFGSFNAVLTSAFVEGAAPEICACAQVVISSRFGSSSTGTAGDENWRQRQRGAARRKRDAGLHFDADEAEPRPQRSAVGHGRREHPRKVGRRELDQPESSSARTTPPPAGAPCARSRAGLCR